MKRNQTGLMPFDPAQQWAAFYIEQKFNAMWRFRKGILNNPDADTVHDMRVASRRLRSVMMDFRDLIPDKAYRALFSLTKMLTEKLGIIRDADILIENLQSISQNNKPAIRDASQILISNLQQQKEDGLAQLKLFLDELDRKHYEIKFHRLILDIRNG